MILKIVGIKELSKPDLQLLNVAVLADKMVATNRIITSAILRSDVEVTKVDKKFNHEFFF